MSYLLSRHIINSLIKTRNMNISNTGAAARVLEQYHDLTPDAQNIFDVHYLPSLQESVEYINDQSPYIHDNLEKTKRLASLYHNERLNHDDNIHLDEILNEIYQDSDTESLASSTDEYVSSSISERKTQISKYLAYLEQVDLDTEIDEFQEQPQYMLDVMFSDIENHSNTSDDITAMIEQYGAWVVINSGYLTNVLGIDIHTNLGDGTQKTFDALREELSDHMAKLDALEFAQDILSERVIELCHYVNNIYVFPPESPAR